ncbi:hypothetical protein ACH42_07750 [Endozoicomonas sp. (ex Bugula neritina AB1)]|nr:hypothetical protein ACH42_07750 [Endozoicomonas sp. (ex Bugula neritina AB1)]
MNTINDIEIYVKNLLLDDIQGWLTETFDTIKTINTGNTVHDLEVTAGDKIIPVMIVERAVGKAWTSIWFKTSDTPWKDDTECAKSLQVSQQCRIRCNSGPWQEGADMDEWWQLDEQGEETIIKWPNAQ